MEYVKEEAKMVYLLECLQKTPPPVSTSARWDASVRQRELTLRVLQVLLFAEKKADVDAIHEYLLLKGVEAVAIHGGKGEAAGPGEGRWATPVQLLLITTGGQPASDCTLLFLMLLLSCRRRFINVFFLVSDQEERTKAIEAFKEGKKDVLVATDVASKGLDFPAIQHVVNYDMPEEIENYGVCVYYCIYICIY